MMSNFGMDQMRCFAEVYWWFRADGRVLYGLPTAGFLHRCL